MNSAASASMSSCSTVRTDSRIRSTASPVRNTSSRSDTADWGKAIGLVSFGECLAVHTEDLADGSHIYEAAPATLNPHHSAGRSPQDEQGRVVRRHALCGLRRSRPDLAQLEKLEAEGLDLRKEAGEHGLTAGQLGRHRGKGGQSSRSEPTPYPDGVQAWRHATTVLHDWVLRRRRNPAIGART